MVSAIRDLPIPGSPEISTTQPSPPFACSHRRMSRSISSSRPTSGVVVARNASNRLSAGPVPNTCYARTLGEAFQGDGPKVAVFEQSTGQPLCARRDDDSSWLGQRLEASSQIRGFADYRLFLCCAPTDQVADHYAPSRNTNSHLQG